MAKQTLCVYFVGYDSGPSPELVSRMLEEALEGERTADGTIFGTKSRSKYVPPPTHSPYSLFSPILTVSDKYCLLLPIFRFHWKTGK